MVALGYLAQATLGTQHRRRRPGLLADRAGQPDRLRRPGQHHQPRRRSTLRLRLAAGRHADPLVKMGITSARPPSPSPRPPSPASRSTTSSRPALPRPTPARSCCPTTTPPTRPSRSAGRRTTAPRRTPSGSSASSSSSSRPPPANAGSQVTPAVDTGWVGLYVITVNYGQTQITAANIAVYPGAPFIAFKLNTLTPGFSRLASFASPAASPCRTAARWSRSGCAAAAAAAARVRRNWAAAAAARAAMPRGSSPCAGPGRPVTVGRRRGRQSAGGAVPAAVAQLLRLGRQRHRRRRRRDGRLVRLRRRTRAAVRAARSISPAATARTATAGSSLSPATAAPRSSAAAAAPPRRRRRSRTGPHQARAVAAATASAATAATARPASSSWSSDHAPLLPLPLPWPLHAQPQPIRPQLLRDQGRPRRHRRHRLPQSGWQLHRRPVRDQQAGAVAYAAPAAAAITAANTPVTVFPAGAVPTGCDFVNSGSGRPLPRLHHHRRRRSATSIPLQPGQSFHCPVPPLGAVSAVAAQPQSFVAIRY